MPHAISKPGPHPKSCLTCRRRRKKCDLSRPSCKRCSKGGFKCLGYEDINPQAIIHEGGPSAPIASETQPISALNPTETMRSNALMPDSATKDRQDPINTYTDHDSRPSILGAALVYRLSGPTPSTSDRSASAGPLEEFDYAWQRAQSQPSVRLRSSTRQLPRAGQFGDTSSSVKDAVNDCSRVVNDLCQSIPSSVDTTMQDHFGHVIYEHDLQRSNYWFMSPPPATRSPMLAQVKWSKGMTWTLYLEARLFQALDESLGTPGSMARGYTGWIDKLEERLTTGFHSRMSLSEVANRFEVQLEVVFLKFVVVNSAMGYTLLRKALPKFLQIVAANSNLYTELPNGNLVVSFPRTLSAPRYELRRFALYDTITSFILGLPPLVDYAHDGECDSGSHGLEWIHGIPVLLLQVIAQVNSWRASSKTPLEDWEALERRVLAWRPSSAVQTENSDTDIIGAARVAVQEGWRHVVLIYLYMGICGVSSHDSRVQASVHRIFQLGKTKTVTDLPIGVHMFTPCVVAGLAARLEKHRVLVREVLLSFKGNRVWLFQGPQFSQVLYHLWHGVGAGGAPVKWDDYVQSRCEIIPI